MLRFVLPDFAHKKDVLSFYGEFEKNNQECIGYKNHGDFDKWLAEMQNRKNGINLLNGYVRENFYLCYNHNELIGVFSLKFELTEFLLNYGGHIGYAVKPSCRNRGYATQMLSIGKSIAKSLGFDKLLLVCNTDNIASEKVIIKNNGIFENSVFDDSEGVFVKRYWIYL